MNYITKDKGNRVKLCCVADKDFQPSVDYLFTFTSPYCCTEYTMTLQGDFCGTCAEFFFTDKCDDSEDLNIPVGIYRLVITKTTDNSVLYKTDQLRVQS